MHCVHREIAEGVELTWDYGDEFRTVLEENRQIDSTAEESRQKAATALYSLASAAAAGTGAGASAHTHLHTQREREKDRMRDNVRVQARVTVPLHVAKRGRERERRETEIQLTQYHRPFIVTLNCQTSLCKLTNQESFLFYFFVRRR